MKNTILSFFVFVFVFLMGVLASPFAAQGYAQSVPAFDGTQYMLQFKNSKLNIARIGTSAQVQTLAVDAEDANQLWVLQGSAASCQIQNAGGEYLTYGGSRLTTSTTEDASGWAIVATTNSNYKGAYELKWLGTSDSKAYVNQFGGTGVGTTLGLWNAGDVNNSLAFIDPANMEYPDFTVEGVTSFSPEHPLTLWYNTPATLTERSNIWMEYSLPIGNGQLGASLFGGVHTDELQFNEKTLWTGTPNDIGSYGQYKNFGSVLVKDVSDHFGNTKATAVHDYVRWLDIESGLGGVSYKSADGQTAYRRTYFASRPDEVVVARYEVEGKDRMHLLVSLSPGEDINARGLSYSVGSTGAAYATFYGDLATVSYNARVRVIPEGEGAAVTKTDDGLEITDATAVTVLLCAATTFDGSVAKRSSGTAASLRTDVLSHIGTVAEKGYESVLGDHLTDFASLMGRVSVQLGGASAPTDMPTNALVDNYNDKTKNKTGKEAAVLFLEQLYFNYGRYLEVSSSRGVDVPSNLQGIWNNLSKAPWNSDIHTNINVQMNYWPAEPTNLSETHLPFLNYIIANAASANWKKAATQYAKVSNGWTVFTESNIYGGMSTWGSNYFVANAWYTSHLWLHYRYTRDEAFLLKAFPAMWSAAQFWMERMKVAGDGTYEAPDEYSPEQNAHSKEDGTAHAQQLIYELLSNVRDAVEILGQTLTGITDAQLERLTTYLEKTDNGLHTETYTANTSANSAWTNPRNGVKKGATILREWKYATYDVSDDPSHRHLSHLMALYPLGTIGPSSPYFEPSVNSLRLRGDEATGWSMGWKVNLWARAQDGDHAHTILHNALKHSTSYGTNQYAGGIYYNLYDSHSPFQIDGNFGVCSGVAEMLLQSYTDTLMLLPALPTVWASAGYARGLRAVGGFVVDQEWKDTRLTQAVITAVHDMACPVMYSGIGDRKVTDSSGAEVAYKRVGPDCLVIDAREGETYTIDMSQPTTVDGLSEVSPHDYRLVRRGAEVLVTGDPDSIQVFNAAGAQLLSTRVPQFRMQRDWGTILVRVSGKGHAETYKMR